MGAHGPTICRATSSRRDISWKVRLMSWAGAHYRPPGVDINDPRLSPLRAPDLPGCRLPTKAQSRFEHALAIARQQQAKSWELRAAMSLARLWHDQGKLQKRANCLLRFTGALRRGSTRAI